jgi:hypothetical protein
MIVDIFFILEFVDLFRDKITKETIFCYLSESIDSIMKYSNINVGFINENIVQKIYSYLHPFSFGDIKNLRIFPSFNSFSSSPILQEIQKGNSPFAFIVNKFAYYSNGMTNIKTYFEKNMSDIQDEIIAINYPIQIGKKPEKKSFSIDYRLSQSEYNNLLNEIKAKKVITINESGIEPQVEVLKSEDVLFYDKGYLLELSGINEGFNCNLIKENMKLYIKDIKGIKGKYDEIIENSNKYESFKQLMKIYLEMNKMDICEFKKEDNIIYMKVLHLISGNYSEVEIDISNNSTPEILVDCGNYEDCLFLNTLLVSILN